MELSPLILQWEEKALQQVLQEKGCKSASWVFFDTIFCLNITGKHPFCNTPSGSHSFPVAT